MYMVFIKAYLEVDLNSSSLSAGPLFADTLRYTVLYGERVTSNLPESHVFTTCARLGPHDGDTP